MFLNGRNIIVVNDYSEEKISDFTEISPKRFLPKNNLILWTILNGFKMFPAEDVIVIAFSDFELTDKMLTVAGFAYSGEKHTDLGVISLDGDKEYGNLLYAEVNGISLNAFALTRNLANGIEKDLTDELIFGDDIPDERLTAMLKRTERRLLRLSRL